MSSHRQPMPRAAAGRYAAGRYAAAGVAGGLVAAVLAAIGLATGVVDGHTTRVVEPAGATASPRGGGGDARGLTPAQIDARSAPGVALVQASGVPSTTLFSRSRGVEEGSGFVLDREGHLLTNAHVIARARRVTVQLDARTVRAEVLGQDVSNDLAVLKVDPDEVELHPLPLGDSDDVRVGEPVVAIGNPLGLDRTATAGIVSGLQRHIQGLDGFPIEHVIQTDAAINPGNSGGPLIDAHGRVIGINAQIATGPNGGDANIGFAIPIDTAKAELAQLRRGERVEHPFLGVGTAPGPGGAAVASVEPDGPAADAGLRPGDVVVAVGGTRVDSPEALAQAVALHDAGDGVSIAYRRDGTRHVARVELGTRPSS